MNYEEFKSPPVGPVMDAQIHKLFLKKNLLYPMLPFSTDNSSAIKILDEYCPFFSCTGCIDSLTGKKVFLFKIIGQYQTYDGEGETLAEAICRAALQII